VAAHYLVTFLADPAEISLWVRFEVNDWYGAEVYARLGPTGKPEELRVFGFLCRCHRVELQSICVAMNVPYVHY
jgi:hypothetical protein